jgi:hypothetical protein
LLLPELPAVHDRHHHVEQDQIRMIVLPEVVERLTPVACDGSAVPRGLEDLGY